MRISPRSMAILFAVAILAALLVARCWRPAVPAEDSESAASSTSGADSVARPSDSDSPVASPSTPSGVTSVPPGIHCGTERWAVKTMSDAYAGQVGTTAVQSSVRDLRSLPAPHNLPNTSRIAPTETTVCDRAPVHHMVDQKRVEAGRPIHAQHSTAFVSLLDGDAQHLQVRAVTRLLDLLFPHSSHSRLPSVTSSSTGDPDCHCQQVPTSVRLCQNSGLDPDFGYEREEKLPRFESERRCQEGQIARLLDTEP